MLSKAARKLVRIGSRCSSSQDECKMPLLTQLGNTFSELRFYENIAPDGALPHGFDVGLSGPQPRPGAKSLVGSSPRGRNLCRNRADAAGWF